MIIGYYLDADYGSLRTDIAVRVASAIQRRFLEMEGVEMVVCNRQAAYIVSRFCVAYQHRAMIQCDSADSVIKPPNIGVVADTDWLINYCDRNVFVSRGQYERLLNENNEWIIYNPSTLAVDYCGKPLYR